MDYKGKILEQLKLLEQDKKAKKETFRVRAYQKAILAIKEFDGEIKSIEDLDKISGLVKGSIRQKIIELIKTGEISQVKDISNDVNILKDLSNIFGIGPSKANELVNKHNITTIEYAIHISFVFIFLEVIDDLKLKLELLKKKESPFFICSIIFFAKFPFSISLSPLSKIWFILYSIVIKL